MTSIDRVHIRFHNAGGLIGGLVACAMLVAPVQAQESPDDAWFAWFGCWEAVGQPAGAPGEAHDVCIAPSEGPVGVDLLTVSDNQITATRTLIADGSRHDVEQSGCSGWERSSWSADRQRLYLRSELDCEGGARRVTSGVIAMTSPTEWLEVQTVEAGGYPVVRSQRYRPAAPSVAEAVGLSFPQDRGLAIETARTAASEPMAVEDLAEASRELSPEALELYLYELGGTFDVNAESLVAMADAGVPESTIDLVVALAHPDVFNVNSEARMVGYRPDEPTPAEAREDREGYGRRVYGRFYDPYYYDPYFYDPYGYGYSGYSPFGWGGRYGWRSTGGSVVIVEPRDPEPEVHGRFVKGRGYTRDGAAPTDASRSSPRAARERVGTRSSPMPSRATTRASSSSSRGRASTGSSSGSSSGGRKAKRKGGGGGL